MNIGFWLCGVLVIPFVIIGVLFAIFKEKAAKFVSGFNSCLLSKLKTLDFTDFCPIFWYNDCKDFDKNKSFFLQFSYRF